MIGFSGMPDLTLTQSIVATVIHPRLRDLLERWRHAVSLGGIAEPASQFASHAEHLLVVEIDGNSNRYAHYGAAFTRHFGADLTGQVIDLLPSEILPADRRGMLEFEYTYARRMNRPLWRSYTAQFGAGETETWQRLVLPVADGSLVVGAYPIDADAGRDDDPASALLRFVIERVPVMLDDHGSVIDLALSLRTFCETRLQMAELEVLATRDPLTGLFNLRHFHQLAELELDHAQRMGRSFSLLALDIDHFKTINDTWGHAIGDEALKAFVAACRMALREYDILGRVGGEEFAVALPNTGSEGACVIAGRLRRQVEQIELRPTESASVSFTVSIGLASCVFALPSPGDNAQLGIPDLLKRADEALYRAKAAGRNRVVIADSYTNPH